MAMLVMVLMVSNCSSMRSAGKYTAMGGGGLILVGVATLAADCGDGGGCAGQAELYGAIFAGAAGIAALGLTVYFIADDASRGGGGETQTLFGAEDE